MPKQTSVNLDITSNPDGFDISGGTVSRKLTLTGGNATFVGGGATYTLPSSSATLVGASNVVSSVNGITGSVSITGDGSAVVGVGNNAITAKLATDSVTGVARFSSSFFSVSNGLVSLASPYSVIGVTGIAISDTDGGITGRIVITGGTNVSVTKDGNKITISSSDGATGNTVLAGVGIRIPETTGSNRTINNIGVTSFNGLTGAVTLTGDGGAIIGTGNNRIIPRLVTSGTTGIASFNTTHFSVSSSTGHVSLATAYTVTGHTVTGDGSAITVAGSNNSRNVTVRVAKDSFTSTDPDITGVAAFDSTYFNVFDGWVTLSSSCSPCANPPFSSVNTGMGASASPNGSLAYLYLDVDNLAAASSTSWDVTRDQVVIYDGGASSLVKTKKAPFKTFFLSDAVSSLFSTNTSGQVEKTKSGDAILYNIKTGNIAAGQEGLIKGSTAFAYIAQNTVKSINGQTGDIECIAVTCAAQTFTGLQTFATGISAANLSVSGGATFGTVTATTFNGTLNGNASTATTASNSNSLGGTAANSWALQSWVTTGLNGKANTTGNNASGTWPISITGNAATSTTATNANSLGGTAANSWALLSAIGNGTLTLNVSGVGLTSGIQTFTANQSGAASFTVTSNATNANTASTVVARDASGNFSAGTITATLSGTASGANTATNSTQLGGTAANSWALQSWVTSGLDGKANTNGSNATGTWPINITGNAGSATNSSSLGGTAANSWALQSWVTSGLNGKANTTGNNASGTWPISITGNAGSATTATTATNANSLGGTAADSWALQSWVTSGLNGKANTTGNNATGTWPISITGNAATATTATTASNANSLGGTAANSWALLSAIGNGTLTLNVSGVGLTSGVQTFTANQSGAASFTVTSNATSANTASAIVARDASGNFSAGTITAILSGTASSATTATNSTQLGGTAADSWALQSWVTSGLNGKANTTGNNATGTWPISITGNAGSATNASSLGGTAANSWALQSWVTSGLDGKANTSGSNASGTWPISITGNAATSTTASNSNSLGGTAANSWALQTWVTSGLNTKANTTGNNATGTWPINITGNAGSATTATTATNSTQLGGTGADLWALQSWVTSGLNTKANTTGNNASGTWPISITGNAATATTATTASQVSNALTIGSGLAGTSSTYNGSAAVTISNVGVTSLNGLTGARTLTGDGGAIVGVGNDTIRARLATASLTGVASFPATDFGVSTTGVVSLTGNVARTNITNSFTALQRFNASLSAADSIFVGRGVTSVEIAFRDISGDIFNPVPSTIIKTNDSKGLYLLHTTGTGSSLLLNSNGVFVGHNGESVGGVRRATLSIGSAVVEGISSPSSYRSRVVFNNYSTIDGSYSTTINRSSVSNSTNEIELPHQDGVLALTRNLVSSFNGLTGAVTLTGDGGAIVGVGNNAVRARLATASLTGVASFPATDFAVSAAGAVTLTGNVAKTNVTQTFTGLQTVSGGLSAGGGVTFSSPIASPGYRYTSSAFETKSAGFTLATADNGKVFVMNNSTTAQVTIDAGLPVGFACEFLVVGAGRVDMVAGNGVTLVQYTERNYPNTRTQLISYATDTFFVSASTPNTV